MTDYRLSRDTLGEVRVPASAYFGPQTQRAVDNFAISGLRLPRRFIRAQALIKAAAAAVHRDCGELEEAKAEAIIRAAQEVAEGKWDDQFVVDVYQAGAGHLAEHERQRGDRQPGAGAARQAAGRQGGDPPQR